MIKNKLISVIPGIAFLFCMNLQIISAEEKTEVKTDETVDEKVKGNEAKK